MRCVLAVQPRSPKVHDNLALSWFIDGNFEEAARLSEKVVDSLDPNNAYALGSLRCWGDSRTPGGPFYLGVAEANLGRFEAAREHLEGAGALRRQPRGAGRRARNGRGRALPARRGD